ncbi:hypothetical protein ACHQM5_019019 [Ranunculus cassubicifolius]
MEAGKKTFFHGRQIHDDIIFTNILSRVPVKSLCRWKLVSKPWCNFIQDPVFADEIRPRTRPQWIRLPPSRSELPAFFFTNVRKREVDAKYDMDIHIYSVDEKGAEGETILNKHVCPPDTFLVKQYNGLVCSYHGSFQLTVLNTTTQESVNISLPLIKDQDHFRTFEYGIDPLSEKYKVFTYRYGGRTKPVDPMDVNHSSPSKFKIITLGDETLTWRSLEHMPNVESLPDWVTIANGKLFWFLQTNYCERWKWSKTARIISFNLATEEFATISLPKTTEVHLYFKRPLFEFEGSLCYVENMCIGQQQKSQLPLNVWMLKDEDAGVWVPMAKNMILSLSGTNLETLGTRCFNDYTTTMEDVEFSIHDGELVVAAYDNQDQYVYRCSFLNNQCKRMKIVGRPFKHPTVEENIDAWNTSDGVRVYAHLLVM